MVLTGTHSLTSCQIAVFKIVYNTNKTNNVFALVTTHAAFFLDLVYLNFSFMGGFSSTLRKRSFKNRIFFTFCFLYLRILHISNSR